MGAAEQAGNDWWNRVTGKESQEEQDERNATAQTSFCENCPGPGKQTPKKISDEEGDKGGELKDLTTMFDQQLEDTRDFFTEKRTELESGTLFPGTVTATRYLYFMSMVKTNAPYDLKNKQYKRSLIGYYSLWHGEKMQFGDYGQINYGVAAKAYGISLADAIHFAGINQVIQGKPNWNNKKGWFDGPGETELIIRGYNMFK